MHDTIEDDDQPDDQPDTATHLRVITTDGKSWSCAKCAGNWPGMTPPTKDDRCAHCRAIGAWEPDTPHVILVPLMPEVAAAAEAIRAARPKGKTTPTERASTGYVLPRHRVSFGNTGSGREV